MSRWDIHMSRHSGGTRPTGLSDQGGRKGNTMNTGRLGKRAAGARRSLVALLALSSVLGVAGPFGAVDASPSPPPPAVAMTPSSDCDDPAAWAAAHAATVVELAPALPVALLGRGGPYAVVGTDGADLVFGSGFDDLICGYDGRDVLLGAFGDDTISGGDGRDLVFGGSGDDTCDDDGGDRLGGCELKVDEPGIEPNLSIRFYRNSIDVTPRTSFDVLNTPVAPVVDCVRARSDGLMEAVIGHRTRDNESHFGQLVEVDDNRRPTDYQALPEFFLEGEHPHVFAIAYDPRAPRHLELTVTEPVFNAPSIVWRTDIDLGEGPPTCGDDVAAILPIARKASSDFFSFEGSFLGSFSSGVGFPVLHYFEIVPLATVHCTGGQASPLRFDFDMVFQDDENVRPLTPAQTIEVFELPPDPPFIKSTTPVRTFDDVNQAAGLKIDADVFAVCETPQGEEVQAGHPLWMVGDDRLSVDVSYSTGDEVFEAFFSTEFGGFRRFR